MPLKCSFDEALMMGEGSGEEATDSSDEDWPGLGRQSSLPGLAWSGLRVGGRDGYKKEQLKIACKY